MIENSSKKRIVYIIICIVSPSPVICALSRDADDFVALIVFDTIKVNCIFYQLLISIGIPGAKTFVWLDEKMGQILRFLMQIFKFTRVKRDVRQHVHVMVK